MDIAYFVFSSRVFMSNSKVFFVEVKKGRKGEKKEKRSNFS